MDLITTTKELRDFIKTLEKEKFVTVDTEFIREFTYYPQLCLIQIAPGTGGEARAIDPLAKDMDMAPLKKLMSNKKIVKIFHSAEQDIEMFYNIFGGVPSNVFDTQIAAQVLGFGESVSYAKLVKEICGKHIDKSSRFADWERRPLTNKQVDYALSDVTYLRDIYSKFIDELKEMGREKWIEEDLEDLLDANRYKNDPKEAWKKFKTKHSSPTFLGILKELAKFREETAQKENVPKNRIMRDDAISEIAAVEPLTLDDLKQTRRIHSKSIQNYGEKIIKAVKRGRRFPVRTMINKPKPPPTLDREALLALLKVLLKRQCEKHHVAQKLVATVDDLRELSFMTTKEIKKSKLSLLHGWRNEVYGKFAVKLMSGQLALMVENNEICLLEYDG